MSDTTSEAARLRDAGVTVFSIGKTLQEKHKSMNEFEFPSDPITDYGVSCA